MALTADQLRQLSRLYDRWQSGDVAAREAVQRELDRSSADVAPAFALIIARADIDALDAIDVSATLLPPIPDATRDAAVLAAAAPDSGQRRDGALSADSCAAGFNAAHPEVPRPREAGQHVGPYRLIKELGRGGMGVVWLAERADGQHTRQVALKMPLVENLNWLLAARFARERSILASLEHPGIARLYDAGIDQTTQPYIAIEYVVGLPITTYVSEHKLKAEAIVQLFTRVIEAVAHAHAQLVIHRDIKPSNILVDAKGEPHLLDFGIAKLLDDDDAIVAEATQLTRLSGRALTLDYASPEQVNNANLGTASDVYSLGVVLYELLTGSRPYQPKGPTRRDLELAILEQEPARPSDQMLRTGDSESGKSARRIRGDLDTIVLKALRKDTDRRYSTAQAFADDLKRFLADEPIHARPAGLLYSAGKFVQRQRVPLTIATIAGVALTSLGWHAWERGTTARQSEARAASVERLVNSLLQGMNPDRAAEKMFSARELLDRATESLAQDQQIDSSARRQVSLRMAEVHRDIGAYDEALNIFQREGEVAAAANEHRAQARALHNAAYVHIAKRDYVAARAALQSLNTLLTQSVTPPDVLYVNYWTQSGNLALQTGEPREALKNLAEAERARLVASGTTLNDEQSIRLGQGYSAKLLGQHAEARKRLQEALEISRKMPAGSAVQKMTIAGALADIDISTEHYSRAMSAVTVALPDIEKRLGRDNPYTYAALRVLAQARLRTGDFAATQAILDRLLAAPPPFQEREARFAHLIRAMLDMHQGEFGGAIEKTQSLLTPDLKQPLSSARIERLLGEIYLRADNLSAARQTLVATESKLVALAGANDLDVARIRVLLTCLYANTGDLVAARAMLTTAQQVLASHPADEGEITRAVAASYEYLLLPQRTETDHMRARVVADILETRLAWQASARALAARLRAPGGTAETLRLPVVL